MQLANRKYGHCCAGGLWEPVGAAPEPALRVSEGGCVFKRREHYASLFSPPPPFHPGPPTEAPACVGPQSWGEGCSVLGV